MREGTCRKWSEETTRDSFKMYVEKEGTWGRRARVRESIHGKREKRRKYNDGNRKNIIIFI